MQTRQNGSNMLETRIQWIFGSTNGITKRSELLYVPVTGNLRGHLTNTKKRNQSIDLNPIKPSPPGFRHICKHYRQRRSKQTGSVPMSEPPAEPPPIPLSNLTTTHYFIIYFPTNASPVSTSSSTSGTNGSDKLDS